MTGVVDRIVNLLKWERYYNEYGDNWINERLVPYMAMLHEVNEDDWPQFMEELSPQWTLGSLSQLPMLEFSIFKRSHR